MLYGHYSFIPVSRKVLNFHKRKERSCSRSSYSNSKIQIQLVSWRMLNHHPFLKTVGKVRSQKPGPHQLHGMYNTTLKVVTRDYPRWHQNRYFKMCSLSGGIFDYQRKLSQEGILPSQVDHSLGGLSLQV